MLFQLLLVVHVLGAMLWFGASMSLPRRARTALDQEVAVARTLLQGLAREGKMIALAGLITFLTGVSLVMVRGGFGSASPRFHVSLLLALIWLVVGAVFARGKLQALAAAVEGEQIAEEARGHVGKLGMLIGIQHALFLTITILMLWRLG